jgi:signal peptidase I
MSDFPERPHSWEGLAERASPSPSDAPVAPEEPADVPPPLTPVPTIRTVYDADPDAGYAAEDGLARDAGPLTFDLLHDDAPGTSPLTEDPGSLPPPPVVEPAVATAAGAGTASGGLALWKEELIAWFKTLVSAAVYATLIVTFGFQVARVEGYSMSPTLEDQDRLIVNKLAYRLGSPRRNDIVMLYYPKDPDKSFVKRVIAEEGDTVKIEDGRVFVNDVPMADDFVPPDSRGHDDWPPRVVEDGYYFVMGDNRINSSDSRHWGEVPKKYILGRVQLRWWPIPHARLF